jgi:hypothetical protein
MTQTMDPNALLADARARHKAAIARSNRAHLAESLRAADGVALLGAPPEPLIGRGSSPRERWPALIANHRLLPRVATLAWASVQE